MVNSSTLYLMFTVFDYAHIVEIHQRVNSSTLYLMFTVFDYAYNVDILQRVNSSWLSIWCLQYLTISHNLEIHQTFYLMFTVFVYAHNVEIHQRVNSSTFYLMFTVFDYAHNVEPFQPVLHDLCICGMVHIKELFTPECWLHTVLFRTTIYWLVHDYFSVLVVYSTV